MMWIWLVLLYGVIKGIREIVKKKALEKNATIEVLFLYTLLAFVMVLPDAKHAMGLEPKYYFLIGLKSFVIFLAWIFSFMAIKKMPISLYGVLDLSRVLFATLLGVIVLQEALGVFQVIGLIFVSAGLLLLKYRPGKRTGKNVSAGQGGQDVLYQKEEEKERVDVKVVLMAFASCLFNAVSGLLDKVLMKDINSSQLQFWYLLFLVCFYLLFILAARVKIAFFQVLKNYWVWILSLLIVVADRVLFLANGMDGSRVTVMTLLKQAGCVVTILAGRFLFHEKNTGYKLFCAAVIIAGIVIGVM
mgnify:FL=1